MNLSSGLRDEVASNTRCIVGLGATREDSIYSTLRGYDSKQGELYSQPILHMALDIMLDIMRIFGVLLGPERMENE